jgi:hypothetical protein
LRSSRQGEEDGEENRAPWLRAEQRWRRRELGRQGLAAVLSLARARGKQGGGSFLLGGSCEESAVPHKSRPFIIFLNLNYPWAKYYSPTGQVICTVKANK